jgi:hypothetical protein
MAQLGPSALKSHTKTTKTTSTSNYRVQQLSADKVASKDKEKGAANDFSGGGGGGGGSDSANKRRKLHAASSPGNVDGGVGGDGGGGGVGDFSDARQWLTPETVEHDGDHDVVLKVKRLGGNAPYVCHQHMERMEVCRRFMPFCVVLVVVLVLFCLLFYCC